MLAGLFFYSSEWLLYAAIVIFFILAIELGFYLGRRAREGMDEGAKLNFNVVQGAILGMLGLLLAFTFSMSVSRWDLRKQLILEEANDIGTTYLRAQLLPEPYKSEISKLLQDYVDVQVAFYDAGVDTVKIQKADAEISTLQDKLWKQAAAVSSLDIRAVTTGLFLQSLNDTIDMHTKRLAALANRVPDMIMLLIILLAFSAIALIGYGSGLGRHRHIVPTAIAVLLISVVILIIIDLGRPQRGMIAVGQEPMIQLQQSLKSDSITQPVP